MPDALDNRKILILCHNYEPGNTLREPDAENRFFTYGFGGNLGKNIKSYNPDYEIEVWRLDKVIKERYYETDAYGVKFKVFKAFSIISFLQYSFTYYRELKKEIKKNNPLLVITHTHNWFTYTALFKFKNSKIITTHHGDWSPFFMYKKTSGLRKIKSRIEMFLEKRLLKNIDCIFAIEKRQIPYFELAYPGIRHVMWSSGVNFEFMKELPKAEARKLIGWEPDKKYILYIGKMYKFKQADEMINLWLEIKKERPEVELAIIGSKAGDPWEEFYDMAAKSGALMIGRVLNSELYKYFSASDLYLLLAIRDDYFGGTGIAPLESLACNRPVVSYAMRNYIGDNLAEIAEVPDTIEKYKEAILKVLDNPGLYKNMRESVERYYTHDAVNESVRKVFEELFAQRTKRLKN